MTSSSADAAPATGMEGDARRTVADSKHSISPNELALAVVVGRASEAFDFFVFGIACVLVFPALIFPFADPVVGTLYSFAVFSLAFIVRPLGSIFFLRIDRIHGRGIKLTIALFLLGGSTAFVAFLPSYPAVGPAAIVALVVFRIGQGFGLGGAYDGLASLLSLNAPEKHRGWYAMVPQLGQPIGFIVATALFAFFYLNLTAEDFLSWGWRYPFFVAFTINVVALFARLRLVATPEYGALYESRHLVPSRVSEIIGTRGRELLVGAFVPLASFALFHLVTIFPISYVGLFTDRSLGEFLIVQIVGAFICLGCIVLSGVFADRVGRRRHLAYCAIAIAVFAVASPILLSLGYVGETLFILVGFALLGLSHGQASGAVASNFADRDRYTGSALTSDLAWLLGAGFAPLVALFFTAQFGVASIAIYLLSGAVCTLYALRVNRRLRLVQI